MQTFARANRYLFVYNYLLPYTKNLVLVQFEAYKNRFFVKLGGENHLYISTNNC